MYPVALGTTSADTEVVEEQASSLTAQREAAGNALAQAREQAGMTQKQLGERVGAEERTVRSWESGARTIPERQVVRLASVLNVPPARLRWSSYGSIKPPASEESPPRVTGTTEPPAKRPPLSNPKDGGRGVQIEEPNIAALLQQLAAGRLDPTTLASALLTSTLLRDQREAADARAREIDARTREMRETNLSKALSSPRAFTGAGGDGHGEQAATTDGGYATGSGT